MDLQQRKLTKSEWDSIEKPIPEGEMEVLNLITKGYNDVNLRYNKNSTLLSFLKIEKSEHLEEYLFQKYFLEKFTKLLTSYIKISERFPELHSKIGKIYRNKNKSKSTLKKALIIRTQRFTPELIENEKIFENVLFELIKGILLKKVNQHVDDKHEDLEWNLEYYTLFKLMRINLDANSYMTEIVHMILNKFEDSVSIPYIIENAAICVEQNKILLQYTDMSLFEHQKRVFTASKNEHPKLILYTAPTGTGKTLTPLGLLSNHRVIFVCAARHVGLALAKSAINIEKKVAFAFGCDTADDIRLHYFAAKDYTKNSKTGGIWKVDNSVGNKVELIICDVKSYLPAMYYMLAFNSKENIITYWDEPTITLDYECHECHSIIQKNWKENLIPNVVLSSATLPKIEELTNTTSDFRAKFPDPETNVYNITSYECRKSVPLVNKNGYVISPHHLVEDHEKLQDIITHCENNPTLMRYFDVNNITECILYAHQHNYTQRKLERYFASLEDVSLMNIKKYYIQMLKQISPGVWGGLHLALRENRKKINENTISSDPNSVFRKIKSVDVKSTISPGINSMEGKELSRIRSETGIQHLKTNNNNFGVFITTNDAYTLTDGPTIYISDEPDKIAKFCIQQANIPETVISSLLQSIEFNNTLNDKIEKIERNLEDALPKENKEKGSKSNDKKADRALNEEGFSSVFQLKETLESHKKLIKPTRLNDTFVPNKKAHLEKWAFGKQLQSPFTSNISDKTIVDIMSLKDVSNSWKILLMMGIGVFTTHKNVAYTEIMKQLADQQELYLIIASSDYVYGTNYQFCHGYISKNMNLTQEKIIQAIGRVGRNGIQQKYTVRFRDDESVTKLFTHEDNKPEVVNMNRLFYSNT